MKSETKKLKKFFEEAGMNVNLIMQDNVQCAELEEWTDGGVNMLIFLNPFTAESFRDYVDGFDVEEEIELHRQDPSYKKAFTLRQSLNDFDEFEKYLLDLCESLDNI